MFPDLDAFFEMIEPRMKVSGARNVECIARVWTRLVGQRAKANVSHELEETREALVEGQQHRFNGVAVEAQTRLAGDETPALVRFREWVRERFQAKP